MNDYWLLNLVFRIYEMFILMKGEKKKKLVGEEKRNMVNKVVKRKENEAKIKEISTKTNENKKETKYVNKRRKIEV